MVELISDEDLRHELSAFYDSIEDSAIDRLKNLCIIHNKSGEYVCDQLFVFMTNSKRKELKLSDIDLFETFILNRLAIEEQKNLQNANKIQTSGVKQRPNDSFLAMTNEMYNSFNESIESKPIIKTEVMDQYVPQVLNQSVSQVLNQSVSQVLNQSVSQVLDQSVSQVLEESVSQVLEESVSQVLEESVTQVLEESITKVENEVSMETCISPVKVKDEDNSSQTQDMAVMTTPLLSSQSHNDSISTLIDPGNFRIICYIGNSLNDNEWKNKSHVKYKIDFYDQSIALNTVFSIMSFNVFQQNEIMNQYIDRFSDIIRDKCEIDSWAQFGVESAAESYYIGRIRYDWNKSKLDDKSVLLEGSSALNDNEVIPLDLSFLDHYSLFPGQVIACKASNQSGKSLIVREMIDFEQIISYPKCAPTLTQALHIVVTVGPYSKSYHDNKSLTDLIEYVKTYKPDFLIMIGPFLDLSDEGLLSTDRQKNIIFQTRMQLIELELQYTRTEIILIPSTRDATTFNVIPTMPLNFNANKFHLYPNPTLININGVIIGITSTDVLLHMSKEEISVGQSTDRMARLCKHIITQKNFYPIFPPNNDINLEITKYDYLRLPVTPHILILPSDLKQFAKNVSKTVVINTGRVCKNNFTRIKIDPIEEKTYDGSLLGHIDVEIMKLNV